MSLRSVKWTLNVLIVTTGTLTTHEVDVGLVPSFSGQLPVPKRATSAGSPPQVHSQKAVRTPISSPSKTWSDFHPFISSRLASIVNFTK
jgi:hypothetical protein